MEYKIKKSNDNDTDDFYLGLTILIIIGVYVIFALLLSIYGWFK